MSLNLNILKKKSPSVSKSYTYSDLKQDIQFGQLERNFPGGVAKNNKDFEVLYDEEAIKNSILNAFTTVPGQKLLNPLYGMDLRRFLFRPITEETGREIAKNIHDGLPMHEPRVGVTNVKVNGRTDSQTYEIEFTIVFPRLNNKKLPIKGVLGQNNFLIL